MPRQISSNTELFIIRDEVKTCHIARMDTTGGVARFTDWANDIVWDGNTYLSTGHLLGFSDIVETPDLELTSVTLTLSAVDQTYIALALQGQTIQRLLTIWRAVMNASDQLILDPIQVFDGRMDGVVIDDDPDAGQSTISVTAWSDFGDLTGKRGRYTTDPMQQALFPGDTIFLFASDAPKDLPWGRPSA